MNLSEVSHLEQQLLETLNESDQIRFSQDNIPSLAQSFGVTSQQLAEAKNRLQTHGYVEQVSNVFTGGDVILRITAAGRELLHQAALKKGKRWWELWK